jgi:LPS-assembly protein
LRGIKKWVILSITILFFTGSPFLIYGEERLTIESKEKETTPLTKKDEKEAVSPILPVKEKPKSPKKPDKEAPITIEADRIEYIKETDTYEAWGSVKITQEKAHLESDYATLDNISGDALAVGNVWYDDGESVLITDRIEMNFNTKLGIIYKGRIFHRPDNYHIEGEEIEKIGESIYEIKKGSFTTCDALVPPWRFRGRDMKVHLDENITGKDIVFYIKGLPCLYTPYLKVPIKKERHSGFLLPRIGYSDQKGYIMQNAYYWAMADNMDSTYYLDYRSKIGFGAGMEYRYIFSNNVRGDIHNYFVRDKELKKDFWELKFNHKHPITKTIDGKANIIYLSEPIYYQRFSTMTEERIQRGLESNVELSQDWSASRLYVRGQYKQNLVQSNADTLQRLPEIGYNITTYKFGELPIYFGLESTDVNFWRKVGQEGQRLNIYPQISSSLNLGRGFVFSPRAGFRERVYLIEDQKTDKGIYDFGTTIGTKIFRILEVDGIGGMSRMKHAIEPSLSYAFVPEVNQDNLPKFDEYDSIQKTNKVTYSLTNRLIGKFVEGEKKRTFEFFTLKLSQDYDFNSLKNKQKPLTDILTEATFRTPHFLSLNLSSAYNPYVGYMTSLNSSIKIMGNSRWHVSIDETYTKSTSTKEKTLFFTSEGSLKLSKSIDLFGKIWYDGKQKKVMESDIKGTYTSQCWAFTLIFINKPEEKQFLMSIDLKGLGTVKLPSFSQRAI